MSFTGAGEVDRGGRAAPVVLRGPVPADGAAIAAIDAEGLATGHASFREKPHDWESFSASYLAGRGIALVAEDADAATDTISGWAGVAPTSTRAVYCGVGEVSVYVGRAARGRGVGRELLRGLVAASEEAGYWTLVAQIFPENEASVALHAALGFRRLGRRERLGRMTYGPLQGWWRDVVMMERRSTRTGRD